MPYALNQIHGWINPYSAKNSGLTTEDVQEMFKALWNSINNANTRSKSNQNSVLLLQIVYHTPNDKLYGVDKLVTITSEKEEEQIRGMADFQFDFNGLKAVVDSPKVKEVRFYTEIESIKNALLALGNEKIKSIDIFTK